MLLELWVWTVGHDEERLEELRGSEEKQVQERKVMSKKERLDSWLFAWDYVVRRLDADDLFGDLHSPAES